MARRQDELVKSIRAHRLELRRELDAFLALQPLKTQIRDHPGPWLLGSVLVGVLASRFLVAPLWQRRRQLAGNWVRSRLKDAVLGLAAASARTASTIASAAPRPSVSQTASPPLAERAESGSR